MRNNTNIENKKDFTKSLPCFSNPTGSVFCQICPKRTALLCFEEQKKINLAYYKKHPTLNGLHFDDEKFLEKINQFALTIKERCSPENPYKLSFFVKKVVDNIKENHNVECPDDVAQMWIETYVLELKHPDLKEYINYDIPKFELEKLA